MIVLQFVLFNIGAEVVLKAILEEISIKLVPILNLFSKDLLTWYRLKILSYLIPLPIELDKLQPDVLENV